MAAKLYREFRFLHSCRSTDHFLQIFRISCFHIHIYVYIYIYIYIYYVLRITYYMYLYVYVDVYIYGSSLLVPVWGGQVLQGIHIPPTSCRSMDHFVQTFYICFHIIVAPRDLSRKQNWVGNMNFGSGNARNDITNVSKDPQMFLKRISTNPLTF